MSLNKTKQTKTGDNQFQMLSFGVGNENYGVNVFKVREILTVPNIYRVPGQSDGVSGIITVRGESITLFDLPNMLGAPPLKDGEGVVILTEFNRCTQGFWVDRVNRIHTVKWDDVTPPPSTCKTDRVTAVVNCKDEVITILDLEGLIGHTQDLDVDIKKVTPNTLSGKKPIMVVDDSRAARNMVKKCIEQMGGQAKVFEDGLSAWDYIQEEPRRIDAFSMLISDIEMPKMDGYTLTSNIKSNPETKDLKVVLHSSMSGSFSQQRSDDVEADLFLPKFHADELQQSILNTLTMRQAEHA